MDQLPHPENIREIVLRTFSQLCHKIIGQDTLRETVLIRQDHFYGRAYRSGGMLATLDAKNGTLSFYDETGQLLHRLALAEPAEEQRQAA